MHGLRFSGPAFPKGSVKPKPDEVWGKLFFWIFGEILFHRAITIYRVFKEELFPKLYGS